MVGEGGGLADYAGDLRILAAKTESLATAAHPDLTLRQAIFFTVVALHRSLGETVTVSGLRSRYGLGRSITKSKAMLMEPTARSPDALGWLRQEADPQDRRQQCLHLTPRGWAVAATLDEAGRPLTLGIIARRVRDARRVS